MYIHTFWAEITKKLIFFFKITNYKKDLTLNN